jgi:hypothetical protein
MRDSFPSQEPLSQSQRVDRVCNRFEKAWQAEQRPRIEDYLCDLPEADRPFLLRELLGLELAYRRRAHESPELGE